jgi:hypothetical protein
MVEKLILVLVPLLLQVIRFVAMLLLGVQQQLLGIVPFGLIHLLDQHGDTLIQLELQQAEIMYTL